MHPSQSRCAEIITAARARKDPETVRAYLWGSLMSIANTLPSFEQRTITREIITQLITSTETTEFIQDHLNKAVQTITSDMKDMLREC